MKRIATFFLLYVTTVCNCQESFFEKSFKDPRGSSIVQLDTLDGAILARQLQGSSRLLKYSYLGELLGSTNLDWYGFDPIRIFGNSIYSYLPNNQCDYIDFMSFRAKRYNANLMADISLTDASFENNPFVDPNNPVQNFWYPVYDVLNDSLLVFVQPNKFFLMDMFNQTIPVELNHSIPDCVGLLNSAVDSIWIYGSQGIYRYNGETIIDVSEIGIECLKPYSNSFYAMNDNSVYFLDSAMNYVTSVSIPQMELIENIHFFEDKVYLIGRQSSSEYLITLDTDLEILSIVLIPESELFQIETFIVANGILVVGGSVGYEDMTSAFMKSYGLDLLTEEYVQDIGVESIEILDCRFFPTSSLGIGNYPINNVRFDANVTVRNFTEQSIHNAWLVSIPSFVFSEWCWPTTYYFQIDTIPPLAAVEIPLINIHAGTRHGAAQGTMVGLNACFRTHAPNGRMDDVPENNKLCQSQSVMFVKVEDITSNIGFTCFYNPTQDHIVIRNISEAQLQLYSSSGQLLQSQSLQRGDNQLPMDRYSSGIYLVRVETKDGVSVVKVGKP